MAGRHAALISLLQRAAPAAKALREEYARAASQTSAAFRILVASDARSRAELFSQLSPPPRTRAALSERMVQNALYFRTNYVQALCLWLLICAARHPMRMLTLVAAAAIWFHAIVVRRGVVHLPHPSGGKVVTLMDRRLYTALAAASALLLLLFGGVGVLCLLSFAPIVLLAHAASRVPILSRWREANGHASERHSGERADASWEAAAAELRLALRSAFHDKEVDVDALEGGTAHEAPQYRDPEVVKRVEKIRQKYKPPRKGKKASQD